MESDLAAAGAEFREGCQVEGLLFDGDRVAGVVRTRVMAMGPSPMAITRYASGRSLTGMRPAMIEAIRAAGSGSSMRACSASTRWTSMEPVA